MAANRFRNSSSSARRRARAWSELSAIRLCSASGNPRSTDFGRLALYGRNKIVRKRDCRSRCGVLWVGLDRARETVYRQTQCTENSDSGAESFERNAGCHGLNTSSEDTAASKLREHGCLQIMPSVLVRSPSAPFAWARNRVAHRAAFRCSRSALGSLGPAEPRQARCTFIRWTGHCPGL